MLASLQRRRFDEQFGSCRCLPNRVVGNDFVGHTACSGALRPFYAGSYTQNSQKDMNSNWNSFDPIPPRWWTESDFNSKNLKSRLLDRKLGFGSDFCWVICSIGSRSLVFFPHQDHDRMMK